MNSFNFIVSSTSTCGEKSVKNNSIIFHYVFDNLNNFLVLKNVKDYQNKHYLLK
ncbi:hypothetical protein [Spiroplasma ixodetis]|uniref:hypothetical protein n=1 Tax=Spiroplasma ixodetis TaxID=2141 RepID=UPI00257623F0|nr:hypothetical protein [Spiroplasma ixodetis]